MVVIFRKLRLAKERWRSDTLSYVAYKRVVGDGLQLKKSSFSLNFNNYLQSNFLDMSAVYVISFNRGRSEAQKN